MTRDFTLEKYGELVSALKGNYRVMGVGERIAGARGGEFIIAIGIST